MKVSVMYFAGMREHTGKNQEDFDLPNPCGSNDVLQQVQAHYPHLADLCKRSRVAIGHDFVREPVAIDSDSEIAVIPPVSGG
jgi:molybdopterin converting factor subunit 1